MRKDKLPLNPTTELFHWGPIPGRMFYPSDFVTTMFADLMDAYGECWPPSLYLFHGGRMVWVNEYPAMRKTGRDVFVKYLLPKVRRERMRREWRHDAVKPLLACGREMARTNLQKLSEKEFSSLWQAFYRRMNAFWVPTIIQELGNYGSEAYLREKLRAAGVSETNTAGVLEALTAPEELSFYQKEEIELAETSDVAAHRAKYFWLKNSYNESRILPLSFFIKRKKELPKHLRKREAERVAEVRRRKRDVFRKHRLPKEMKNIAEAITFGIEWQDERKGHIFHTIHHKALLLNELARRTGIPFETLLDYPCFELEKLFFPSRPLPIPSCPRRGAESSRRGGGSRGGDKRGGGKSPLTKRAALGGCYDSFSGIFQHGRRSRVFTEAEAKKYWKLYVEPAAAQNVRELRGTVASAGTCAVARGRVNIMLDPHALGSFRRGEILVTSMTSPEYVFAMKKAGAIITDTGGLTSHAAVTSRELGKPCIVNTKIATKVLKDGDMVEVDAYTGVVRKL